MTSGGGPLDIFNRIRNLLSTFGLSSKDTPLKRRAPEQVEHPSLTKYRRVSNAFPLVTSRTSEDDRSFIYPRNIDASADMAERRLSQHKQMNISPSIPPPRPNVHTYADLEYSDDDDVIFTNPRHRTVVNSTPQTAGLNSFTGKKQANVIFPDHIPVIVRNSKASSSFNSSSTGVKPPRPTILNGNVLEMPSLVRAFPNSRDNSQTKLDTHRETWHKRLSAKTSREPMKAIPALIEAKTGRLAAASIPVDYAGNFGAARSYVNGIDHPKDTKLTNGVMSDSYAKSSPAMQPPTASQKKLANSSTEKAFNIRERNSYMELLKKIVPGLYKSNDIERNRQQLAQLAQARGATKKNQKLVPTIILTDDDEDQNDVIDLSKDDEHMLSACQKIQDSSSKEENKQGLPRVEPVNSLKDRLETAPKLKPDWLEKFSNSYKEKSEQNKRAIIEASENVRKASQDTAAHESAFIDNFRNAMVFHEPIVLDESEEEEEEEFPEFTEQQRSIIKIAIYRGPQDETLISKFNMNITRRDILTLVGDTWLNDEVINFYMNLLMERSTLRSSEGLPRVYAMNTFFVPRLLQGGHSAVRRWTRKVDIFAHDVIPVPVHVGQVHWCMAIIHLKKKTIKYYDSMGTPNPRLLNALEDYLREESLDKRKEHFDTSKFVKESVESAPRQMNGSDCGVFSCMFAEYITRNREITFSQQHMPYFRQKMVLEIVQGKLLL